MRAPRTAPPWSDCWPDSHSEDNLVDSVAPNPKNAPVVVLGEVGVVLGTALGFATVVSLLLRALPSGG